MKFNLSQLGVDLSDALGEEIVMDEDQERQHDREYRTFLIRAGKLKPGKKRRRRNRRRAKVGVA